MGRFFQYKLILHFLDYCIKKLCYIFYFTYIVCLIKTKITFNVLIGCLLFWRFPFITSSNFILYLFLHSLIQYQFYLTFILLYIKRLPLFVILFSIKMNLLLQIRWISPAFTLSFTLKTKHNINLLEFLDKITSIIFSCYYIKQ